MSELYELEDGPLKAELQRVLADKDTSIEARSNLCTRLKEKRLSDADHRAVLTFSDQYFREGCIHLLELNADRYAKALLGLINTLNEVKRVYLNEASSEAGVDVDNYKKAVILLHYERKTYSLQIEGRKEEADELRQDLKRALKESCLEKPTGSYANVWIYNRFVKLCESLTKRDRNELLSEVFQDLSMLCETGDECDESYMKLLIRTAKRINEYADYKYSEEAEKTALECTLRSEPEDLKKQCIAPLFLIAVSNGPISEKEYDFFVSALETIMDFCYKNNQIEQDLIQKYREAFKPVEKMIKAIVLPKWELLRENANQTTDDIEFHYLSAILATYHFYSPESKDTVFQNAYKFATAAIHSCLRFDRFSDSTQRGLEMTEKLMSFSPSPEFLCKFSSFLKRVLSDVELLNGLSYNNNRFYWDVLDKLGVDRTRHLGINEPPTDAHPNTDRKRDTVNYCMQEFYYEMDTPDFEGHALCKHERGWNKKKSDMFEWRDSELDSMVHAIRTQAFDERSLRSMLLNFEKIAAKARYLFNEDHQGKWKKHVNKRKLEMFKDLNSSFREIMNMQLKTIPGVELGNYSIAFKVTHYNYQSWTSQCSYERKKAIEKAEELLSEAFDGPVALSFINIWNGILYAKMIRGLEIDRNAKLRKLSGIFPDLNSKHPNPDCELLLMILRSEIRKIKNPSSCYCSFGFEQKLQLDIIKNRTQEEVVKTQLEEFQEPMLGDMKKFIVPCITCMLRSIKQEAITDDHCRFLIKFVKKFGEQAERSRSRFRPIKMRPEIFRRSFPECVERFIEGLIRAMENKSNFAPDVDRHGYINYLQMALLNHKKTYRKIGDYKEELEKIVESTECFKQSESYAFYQTMIELWDNENLGKEDMERYRSILKEMFIDHYSSSSKQHGDLESRGLAYSLFRKIETFDPLFLDSLYVTGDDIQSRCLRLCTYIDFTDTSELSVNIYEEFLILIEDITKETSANVRELDSLEEKTNAQLNFLKVANNLVHTFVKIFKMAKASETGNRRHHRYYSSLVLCQNCLNAREFLPLFRSAVLLYHLEDAIRTASRLPPSFPGRYKCLDILRAASFHLSGEDDLEPLKDALKMTFSAWSNSGTNLERYEDIREFCGLPTFENVQREPYWFVTEEDPYDCRHFVEPNVYLLREDDKTSVTLRYEDDDDVLNELLNGSSLRYLSKQRKRHVGSPAGSSVAKRVH